MPVFVVDKPLGLSSHDVVARARRLLGTKRVGHAGTLDPLATGVLVILTEDATKLSPFLTATDKHYLAWVSFGGYSPTYDAEGPLLYTADASRLSEGDIESVLPSFLLLKEQVPPQYSAVKKGGVKGYEAARRGSTLELEARPARYYSVGLLAFAEERDDLPQAFSLSPESLEWRPHDRGVCFHLPEPLGKFPTALISLQAQAGTYIRAFARDLGEALVIPAHLSGLVRTRSGASSLERAISLAELPTAEGLANAEALPYPLITVSKEEENHVLQGKSLTRNVRGRAGLVAEDGHLIAVVEGVAGRAKILRAWAR